MTAVVVPPDVRARLARLSVGLRGASAVTGDGRHRGRALAAGLEFEQYRPYAAGDEPRSIDWKLYARSDRAQVRLAARDSPLRLWLLLDTSRSMAQPDAGDRSDRPNRFEIARIIAAALAERVLAQGDAVGLLLSPERRAVLPLRGGPVQQRALLAALAAAAPKAGSLGAAPDGAERARDWQRAIGRDGRSAAGTRLLVLTDGHDPALTEAACRLAAVCEVDAIRLLTTDELQFGLRGVVRLVDPETGAARVLDAAAAREAVLRRATAARRDWLRTCARAGVRAVEHALTAPADAPLHRLFGRAASTSASVGPGFVLGLDAEPGTGTR